MVVSPMSEGRTVDRPGNWADWFHTQLFLTRMDCLTIPLSPTPLMNKALTWTHPLETTIPPQLGAHAPSCSTLEPQHWTFNSHWFFNHSNCSDTLLVYLYLKCHFIPLFVLFLFALCHYRLFSHLWSTLNCTYLHETNYRLNFDWLQ